jgi:hypothetical protein
VPVVGTTTAFATTGPGAFTGDITTVSGPSITLSAGMMGPNGTVELDAIYAATNNANAKSAIATFGALTALNQSLSIDVTQRALTKIRNEASQSVNKSFSVGLAASGVVRQTAYTRSSVDTSAAVVITFKAAHGTATDNIVLEDWRVKVSYGP